MSTRAATGGREERRGREEIVWGSKGDCELIRFFSLSCFVARFWLGGVAATAGGEDGLCLFGLELGRGREEK